MGQNWLFRYRKHRWHVDWRESAPSVTDQTGRVAGNHASWKSCHAGNHAMLEIMDAGNRASISAVQFDG